MSLRTGILIVAALTILAGSGLLGRSAYIPVWKNNARADAMMVMNPPEPGNAKYDAFMQNWHKDREALRTEKWKLFDLGAGFIALGFSIVATIFLLRIKRLDDVSSLKTPTRRGQILGLCLLAWLLISYATWQDFWMRFEREEFPPWADTPAIPLFEAFVMGVVGCFIISLVWLFSTIHGTSLPASLWVWRRDARIRSWFFSLCAAGSLILSTFVLGQAFYRGPFVLVPAVFLWIYVTLLFRAAAISLPQSS